MIIDTEQLETVKRVTQENNGGKILLYQNSMDENNIAHRLHTLNNYHSASSLRSLDIDYDIYPAREAMPAWFDQELEIFSADNNALQQVEDLINNIYQVLIIIKRAVHEHLTPQIFK